MSVAMDHLHDSSGEETAYEALKGFEPELHQLLDLFSRSEQEASCTTNFNFGDDGEGIEDLPIPDILSEGNSSWTEFLMTEAPGSSIFPFQNFELQNDFFSISPAPEKESQIQPSLPASLFPPATETNSKGGENQPAEENPARLTSQDSCSSTAEIIHQDSREAGSQPEAAPESSQQNTSPESESAPGQDKAQKRKRVSKPKDPNAPKRGRGRPRATLGSNLSKHVLAFEKDGGFSMGEAAKQILSDESSLHNAAEELKAIQSQQNQN